MNSAFTKVSNLKVNRVSKIAITLASSTFFLYALGQAPIFKRKTFFSSLKQNNCPVYDAKEIKKQEQKEAIKKLYS